jgi:DNA-binding transcriptional LysR family regulator
MQIEALQVFCDVARLQSFSRAGEANGITQSAVSQIVSHLEKRMGVRLVDRSTRPLRLTPAGLTYYQGCRDLLERYAELESQIRHAEAGVPVTVQVAAIYSVGLSDMGHLIERFSQLYPHARVHMDYLHPDMVYERVSQGKADLGLVSFPRRQRELVALPWRQERMVLACSPRHPFAGRRLIRPEEVQGHKYVGFDRKLAIRREVDRYWRERGVSLDVVMEFDSIENIKKAIELDAGVALLPEPTLRREVASGSLAAVALSGPQLYRPLAILHRRRPPLHVHAARFVSLLQASEKGAAPVPGPGPRRAARWKRPAPAAKA